MNISCESCHQQGILGTRWHCVQCPELNLCDCCYMNDKHDINHQFIRHDSSCSSQSGFVLPCLLVTLEIVNIIIQSAASLKSFCNKLCVLYFYNTQYQYSNCWQRFTIFIRFINHSQSLPTHSYSRGWKLGAFVGECHLLRVFLVICLSELVEKTAA